MSDDVKKRLEDAQRLAHEGKITIANTAVDPTRGLFDQDDTVTVRGFSHAQATGLVFQWTRKDVGFGELVICVRADGTLAVDEECMSMEFCLGVIRQALEQHVKSREN